MKQFILKNRKTFGIFLALYQLMGGIMGFTVVYSYTQAQPGFSTWFWLTPFLVLLVISVCAGIFYFVKGQKWRFYLLSSLNLSAQVIQIMLSGFYILYYTGAYVAIGMDNEFSVVMKCDLRLANMAIGAGEIVEQSVMINLVPVLLLVILYCLKKGEKANGKEIEVLLNSKQEPA